MDTSTPIGRLSAHRQMKLDAYRRVFGALRSGARSRRDIERLTGLSWGATSQCVKGLLDAGIVRETGRLEGGGADGRRATGLGFTGNRYLVAAVQVRRNGLHAVVADLGGNAVEELRCDFAGEPDGAKLPEELDRLLGRLRSAGGLCEVRLVLSGAVDEARGIWFASPQFPGISGFAAAGLARRRSEFSWRFEHDIVALAREVRQRTQTTENGVFLHLGPGVGMAVWQRGEFLRGAHGFANEIGHLPGGGRMRCACGRTGCLESEFYLGAIGAACRLPELPPDLERWHAGLSAAELERVYRYLEPRIAKLLAIAGGIFDPAEIILAGEIAAPFLERLETAGDALLAERFSGAAIGFRTAVVAAGDAARGSARQGAVELGDTVLAELLGGGGI